MIIAIETSDVVCSVCAYRSESEFSLQELRSGKSHSKMIFSLIDQSLNSLQSKLSDVTALLFSSGPGSFTGLRIGLSAVKGVALGSGLPVAVVPTIDAAIKQIAFQATEGVPYSIIQKINSTEFFLTEFTLSENIVKLEKRLEIISETGFAALPKGGVVFSNTQHPLLPEARFFPGPSAVWIARYYMAHKDEIELLHDFALLEPDYLREFVIKEKVKN